MPVGAALGCLFHPDIQLSAVKPGRLAGGCIGMTRVLVLGPQLSGQLGVLVFHKVDIRGSPSHGAPPPDLLIQCFLQSSRMSNLAAKSIQKCKGRSFGLKLPSHPVGQNRLHTLPGVRRRGQARAAFGKAWGLWATSSIADYQKVFWGFCFFVLLPQKFFKTFLGSQVLSSTSLWLLVLVLPQKGLHYPQTRKLIRCFFYYFQCFDFFPPHLEFCVIQIHFIFQEEMEIGIKLWFFFKSIPVLSVGESFISY